MRNRLSNLLLVLVVPALVGAVQEESVPPPPETPWPIRIEAGSKTLTVYQPQLDSWDGHELKARAAVSASEGDGENAQSTYGIVHATAATFVDKGSRTVTLSDYTIAEADFPSAAPTDQEAWVAALKRDAAGKAKIMSLDQLQAQLSVTDTAGRANRSPLRNDPPRIIFSTAPAMLIYVDGSPVYRPVSGTALERVINTRPLVLKNASGKHYIHVFDGWMSAASLDGRYTPTANPPVGVAADLEKAKKAAIDGRQVDLLVGQGGEDQEAPSLKTPPVPVIHVATSPTELIVTDGEPRWVPIENTDLLYAENTTGHVFKQIDDQNTYVLVTGRWFHARTTRGPWEFMAADALPADFANIPDESPKENVKASVAGTAQAKEAAIEADVPQTAAVERNELKMTAPNFDGEPKLARIDGTPLQYVVNTSTPIVMVDAHSYYAVENGVWFAGTSVRGPWAVADSVPAVIYSIPASSPLHYLTYVKVYSATADTVVVGYTPGYHGTYLDPVTHVVVYGTGYAYTPWIGSVWYGPPVTYGFGVSIRYTPWTGWTMGFGFGWSWGHATVSVGWGWGAYPWWGPYGWGYAWGPRMYPAPYYWGGAAYGWRGGAVAWGPGGWAGTTGNIYSQWGPRASVSRYSAGYNAWTGNAWSTRVGTSYNSRTGIASAGQRGAVHNVYTGNYAAGERGIATGPGGTTAVGRRGTAGNVYTGANVSGGQATVYNPHTGQATRVGGVHGDDGGAVRVGNDVYAGHDGNVYRRTDSGWQTHSGGSWTSAQPSGTLNTQAHARSWGTARTQGYHSASGSMSRNFGGARRGGFRRR